MDGNNSGSRERVGWFDALGNKVPRDQRDAAAVEAKKMGVDHLDLTGTYRFLAALCTPTEHRELHTDSEQTD